MKDVDHYAKIIWDYMLLHHKLEKVDAIFALGSTDLRTPKRAAELYHQGFAPYVICSGGVGKIKDFDLSEAEKFRDILVRKGVPEDKIILEKKASNTGENITFTKELLKNLNFDFNSFILVQKPYMERRTYATFKKQWPEPRIFVTSPAISYEDYSQDRSFKEKFTNLMVGDLQRIVEYPKLGFQIEQDVPDEVLDAWQKLVDMGYTKYFLK
ncbi:YdcF family protein [Patescibacteria group bacterium]|nr:YdcF family protein [Patescibacteria group bacterium]